MAIIDNTIAGQIPQYNAMTPLAEVAKVQNMQAEAQANQFKQSQLELGSEMRGLQPFVNTPEFPAKWRETADRLRQRGVIDDHMHQQWANAPSPLLMKSIISKTEGADLAFRKEEAVRDQKNTDTRFGLERQRIAIANDPTPDNFVKDDTAPGGYRPIGPATPEYKASVAKAEAQAKGDLPTVIGSGSSVIVPNKASEGALFTNKPAVAAMDDNTADFLATRVLAGDSRALIGLGRGAQGAENIAKIQGLVAQKAKEQGVDASGILNNIAAQSGLSSAYRTLGTNEVKFGMAEKAAQESFPIALEASANVPRTQWLAATQLIQKGQTQVNDPNLKKFLIATDTAVKDYARTINPTGVLRESDIEYARKILSTADSPEAYKSAIDQLNIEVGVMHRAIQRQKTELKTGKDAGVASKTKPDAASRFQDLMKANGGDKKAAYATMAKEGY